jgi:hypothetical protein
MRRVFLSGRDELRCGKWGVPMKRVLICVRAMSFLVTMTGKADAQSQLMDPGSSASRQIAAFASFLRVYRQHHQRSCYASKSGSVQRIRRKIRRCSRLGRGSGQIRFRLRETVHRVWPRHVERSRRTCAMFGSLERATNLTSHEAMSETIEIDSESKK